MPLSLDDAPIPLQDPISRPPRPGFGEDRPDPLAGYLSDTWVEYFNRLVGQVNVSPFVQSTVLLTTQAGSIAATDFSGGALGAGLYRITYCARVTQAAGVSSTLTVTFDWTESGVALAVSGSAMTGNLTTTFQSGSVMIRIDAATPVRYSTTYGSVGAPVMQYRLDVVLEEIQA